MNCEGLILLKTILLANHDAAVRTEQKDILAQNGYAVVGEAESVEQSVEKFKELKPDLVIVDFHPEKFDCIKAIKAIKAIDDNVTLVISSNFVSFGPVGEAIQLGVKGWTFTSPSCHAEMLMQEVTRAFENVCNNDSVAHGTRVPLNRNPF